VYPSLIALVTMLISVSASVSRPPREPGIQQVAWLTGCWEQRDRRHVVQEHWMAPLGNTMISTGRTVRGDSLTEFEQVVIRAGAGKLVYEAHPSDQPPAQFTAVAATDHSVVFENRQHEFPQQIGYARRGADSLTAWIAGSTGGKQRRIEFPYARVKCP
jgi:hypothetical protein